MAIVLQANDTTMKLETPLTNLAAGRHQFPADQPHSPAWLTRFFGWFSQIERRWVRARQHRVVAFVRGRLDLQEAKKTRFSSLHDCFIRELKDGMRPVNEDARVLSESVRCHHRRDGSGHRGSRCCRQRGFPIG